MVFKRELRFEVKFDWYTGSCQDRFNPPPLAKTYELDKDYTNRREAYRIGGSLDDWAERTANFKAVQAVSKFVGADAPVFGDPSTWLDVHSVSGSTYSGCNITWEVISSKEPRIPSDVLANIEIILRKIKENIDDVDYVQELNNELDRILSRNDLTREDISDLL